MKRGLIVMMALLTLLIGLLAGYGIGFGVWGVKPTQIAALQMAVQRLTREVFDLKSRLPASVGPAGQAARNEPPASSG